MKLRPASLIPLVLAAFGALAQAAPNPVVQGLQTGFWNVISDNDHNANQSVTDFGDVDVGTSKGRTYRLQNTTDGVLMWEGFSSPDGQFEVRTTSGAAQGFPIPIVGGDDRDFLIRFTPNTTGRSAPIVTLETNAANLGAEYTFQIEDVGRAPEAVLAGRQGSSGTYTVINNGDGSPRLSDGTDFGSIPTGSFVERDFQLSNTGNLTLDPGSAFFVGGNTSDFSIVGLSFGNLSAGNSRNFSIRFDPASSGIKNHHPPLRLR